MILALDGVITFALTALLGKPLIGWLAQLKLRQKAYEDAPQSHQVKTGTPTMGGLLFLIAPLVALCFVRDKTTLPLIVLIAGSAAIGFADDFIAIRGGQNRGLRARTKFLLTALVGTTFLGLLWNTTPVGTVLFGLTAADLWFVIIPAGAWYVLSLAAITSTTHAVNFTDGLDGLAAGTMLPPLAVIAYLAIRSGHGGVAATEIAMCGAILGFLLYNRHPARVFMGDTGSLALGAALAGGAILIGEPLLLPVIGGVFVIEALSVILQVASYKTTKRRIFRMSPLHHHFELSGWSETKVTMCFWLASLVLAGAGLALVVRV